MVIRLMDFENSPADLRQELQSIVGWIEISAPYTSEPLPG